MTGAQDQPSNPWAPPSAPGTPSEPLRPPQVPVPGHDPATGDAGVPDALGVDVVDGTAHPGGPKRSKATVVGAVGGVVALVAAGAFAVVRITGNAEAGGAASPEEVGTSLTAALDDEDVLGVIDLLLPGERDTFRDPMLDLVGHLSRLEILSEDASLSGVGGLDVQFTDVQVRAEPTNVDDITNIYLSGSASVGVDGATVPLGDLLLDEAFGGDRPDMDMEPETSEFDDTRLTVVERDGRWYLSAFYSVAEAARAETDLAVPGTGVEPRGGDTPEGALDALFEAVSDLDLRSAIAVLDPTEFEALHRYAPLFLDDAEAALDDVVLDWGIIDTSYEVTGDGSRRNVAIRGLTFAASLGDVGEVRVVLDGDCITLTVSAAGLDVEEERFCADEFQQGALDDLGLGADVEAWVETVQDALADWEAPGVAVHEVGGEWFVSPMRSGFDLLNVMLASLDADELRDIVRAAEDLVDSVAGDVGDALDDLGVDDGGLVDGFDDGSDTGAMPDGMDGFDEGSDALTECYLDHGFEDAAAGVQCLADGLAAGTIDPDLLTPQLRFPECGVAEVYWNDVYSLPDDEFVAMATEASPCLLDLVAAGEVDEYEVASELLAPQCLEGRNWYLSSDEAYSARFFECVAKAYEDLP